MVTPRCIWNALFIIPRQLAAADAAVLNQLLGAYKRIGLKFPNSDLSSDLKGHPDCQQAMAAMYGDVLEFHTWAYCMLRRRGEGTILHEIVGPVADL